MGKIANPHFLTQAGAETLWREHFWSPPEEHLKHFFFCNLHTSVGLCPGTLFVTTHSLGFVSDVEFEYNPKPDEVAESVYVVSCACSARIH